MDFGLQTVEYLPADRQGIKSIYMILPLGRVQYLRISDSYQSNAGAYQKSAGNSSLRSVQPTRRNQSQIKV